MSNKNLSHFWIKLSEQNKVYFWSIFSTGLVGFFSLWLGITIQDDINTKNARETQKLARYEMVQAVYPKFSQYIDTGGVVFFDLWEIYNIIDEAGEKNGNVKVRVREYYEANLADFVETMNNSVNFMCDNRYFFNKASQKRICSNNVSILFGLHLLERNNSFLLYAIRKWDDGLALRDSVADQLNNAYYAKNLFSYRETAVENITAKCSALLAPKKAKVNSENNMNVYVEDVLYDFVFLPYMDNFNVYQNELMPGDEITNGFWKHLIVLLVCVVLSLCFCSFVIRHVFRARKESSL